jgi:STE24 endopeptidase
MVAAIAAMQEFGVLQANFFSGHILERRYGLSRQPAARWLRDHAKAAAVSLVFSALAAAWVYAWLAASPAWWWLPAWAGLAAAAVVTAWAAPVLLLPLFFRFVPLAEGPLRDRLLGLAARAGVPAIGAFEWRLGDRTSRANAALTGIGQTRRIIVSDTLIADYRPEEVEAVLAHELAHHLHHDIWKGLAVDAAAGLAALVAAGAALRAAAGPMGLDSMSDPAGLPVAALAVTAASWAAAPIQNAVSRAHERRADRTALDLTGNAEAFVTAMRRLGARNLAEPSPAALARLFFHTHPPVEERIASAAAWTARQDCRSDAATAACHPRVRGGAA